MADPVIEVNFESNVKQALSELEQKVIVALKAIGTTAEGYAKENCPVDTGRLRNSITFAVGDFQGVDSYEDDNGNPFSGGAAHGSPESNVLAIGTNVEYAAPQELKDMSHKVGRAHFLRDAASTHGDEYKRLMEAALKD